jgi:hypothetical protein
MQCSQRNRIDAADYKFTTALLAALFLLVTLIASPGPRADSGHTPQLHLRRRRRGTVRRRDPRSARPRLRHRQSGRQPPGRRGLSSCPRGRRMGPFAHLQLWFTGA